MACPAGHLSESFDIFPNRDCTCELKVLMTDQSTIHSPQPVRYLKRKIDAVEGHEIVQSKRQFLASPPAEPFWTLDPIERPRSDTYLYTMSRPPKRSRTEELYTTGIPTPGSLEVESLNGSVHSSCSTNAPTSNSSWFDTRRVDTRTDSRASLRSSGATFRNDLMRHNIFIDPIDVPLEVYEHGQDIVNRKRDSPGISEEDANKVVAMMRRLRRGADESTIKAGYVESGVLPSVFSLPGIEIGCDVPFDMKGMPSVAMGPPLPAPKPDRHYCFSEDQFNAEQDFKQSSIGIQPYAKPTTSGCWPFMMLEFKSQAKGGTLWVAENQNAVSGAFAVHAIQRLCSMADRGSCQSITESIAFSGCLDARRASIWIHYEDGSQRGSVEICDLSMTKTQDVISLRNVFRNVVTWAIQERLPTILDLLSKIALPELQQDEKRRPTQSSLTHDRTPMTRKST